MSVNKIDQQRISKIFSGSCIQNNVCPIKDIMAKYGDKWSMYTVLLLGLHKQMRFNEMKENIKGISQRMLTVTLRSLEEDGIITRKIFAVMPPRVEYQLTSLGEGLLQQFLELAQWADSHFNEIMDARRRYLVKSGLLTKK